jgi:DNA-binding response OmpR family regulator
VSKESLLLVDGDTRSLRVLEVSLRKAGFSVTPAVSVGDALDKLEINAPDLIICETKFATELDGFELRRRLRSTPEWKDIPFIFLTAETAIENKIKGLELGVDDYLTKPIYIKEIVTRINILLQKRQRQFLDLKKDGTRFAGRVADMPVVDVIQTIEVSRKSGVIQFSGGANRQAAIYFRDGKVIDAEAGTLQGEDAVYRLLTWNDGEFEVEFRTVRRREAISTSSQGLLMEGMRRLDEWSRLLEQLPPLSHRFEIDAPELSTRLGDIPDDNNRILRLFDGKRTLLEVIDASDFGDLECLQAISRLYFEGLLIDLDPGVRSKRDTGKPMPLTVAEGVPTTPIEEVVSGPIDIAGLTAKSEAQDSTAPAASVTPAEPNEPAEERAPRARRPSAEQIEDSDVVEEEDIPGPLTGGYRPSSLRLIDEAVAAAQLIEPSLFSPEELIAAGVAPAAAPAAAPAPAPAAEPEQTPVARIQVKTRESDPRIDNARNIVEKSPAFEEPAPINGEQARRSKKPTTQPPPIPEAAKRPSVKEIANAPLLEAEPDVNAEAKEKAEELLAPFADPSLEPPKRSHVAEFDAAEHAEDYTAVPTVIEAEGSVSGDFGEESGTDPSRRRFANTVRRDDTQGLKMIGSHGRDRAEASGELRPTQPKPVSVDTAEPQRELVTIMPRRTTREIPILSPDGTKAGEAQVETETKPAAPTDAKVAAKEPAKPAKPAVEAPARARRAPEGSGVVREAGPGRGAKILLGLSVILAGATVYSLCKGRRAPQQPAVVPEDAQIVVMATEDAPEYSSFGVDATPTTVDAAVAIKERPDAAIAVVRPDAATVVVVPRDAAVATVSDAGGVDRSQQARSLYDKAHEALEEGDPELALELLEQSINLRRTARSFLERARALQRLNRIDEAVAAVDEAIKMNTKFAPAHEQKGMILWSAQRFAEARAPLEKYLELEPDGPKAERIRAMLDEPR